VELKFIMMFSVCMGVGTGVPRKIHYIASSEKNPSDACGWREDSSRV